MTKSIQAWVIYKQWSGDTSARVHFFTPDLGLVECLCKGGRTPKKQSLLQAFTPLWIGMDERHGRYYAQSIETQSPMLPLTGTSLFSGLYINELLYYALSPLLSEPELFQAYIFTLNGLASTQDRFSVESLLRRFEWALLNACGHCFSLTHEARSDNLIEINSCYHFIAGEGFVLAEKGIPGEHLLALAVDDLSDAAFLKSAKIIMRQAIDFLLGGKDIKARALYLS
ncbi:MAG: DNA repair protein RecO C-terminal domain-containing protein [Legionella sp.]|nr:DNA repair protein RecO C-terminal domain-containing protein [Legionella sp.]